MDTLAMSGRPALSVILPAYLEEENLRVLLPRLTTVLGSLGITSEILVVDTNPALDRTADVCASLGAVHVPREGGNRYGDAVRTGIARASGERVLFMDADGSHAPEFIPELWRRRDDAGVIIASRYVDGGFTENSAALVLMSRVLNITYSVVLNLNCKDVSNSFKLYRADKLKALKLKCDNFDVVEEILFKLRRREPDLAILEIPFSFKKRMFGQTKRNLFLFMLTYVYTMIRLRFGGE